MALARAVRMLAGLVCAVIVVAIVLYVLSANSHNVIVSDIHDAGSWLTTPFHNIFSVKGAKLDLALNWGLAAVVYMAVGHLLAMLIARGSMGGRSMGRRMGRRRAIA